PASYTLSLHDALPILPRFEIGVDDHVAVGNVGAADIADRPVSGVHHVMEVLARRDVDVFEPPAVYADGIGLGDGREQAQHEDRQDRKSTRLNSSHVKN